MVAELLGPLALALAANFGSAERWREEFVAMGKALGSPCVTNVWIPDGYKDSPIDRRRPREQRDQGGARAFSRTERA